MGEEQWSEARGEASEHFKQKVWQPSLHMSSMMRCLKEDSRYPHYTIKLEHCIQTLDTDKKNMKKLCTDHAQ